MNLLMHKFIVLLKKSVLSYFLFLCLITGLSRPSFLHAQQDEIKVNYVGNLQLERMADDKFMSTWSDSVIIQVDSIRISAQRGFQNETRRIAALFHHVYLVDSTQQVTSDSLYFFQDRSEFRLYHHIFYRNIRENLVVKGDSLQYFYREKFGKLFGNLWLTFEDFVIEADSAYLYSNLDSLILFGHIQLKKQDMQVLTQLARVYKSRHLVICEIEPQITQQKSFLNGQEAQIFYTGKDVDSVLVAPYAQGRLLAIDSIKNDTVFTDFSGKQIWIHLKNKEIQNMDIIQNAMTHYEYWDKKQREKSNNTLSGNKLSIYFQDNQIARIKIIEGVEGLYHRQKFKNRIETDTSTNKER